MGVFSRISTLLTLLTLVSLKSFAQVRLPELVSDGMVLQRNTSTRIWGWAAPQEKIRVNFTGNDYEVVADTRGNWEIILKPHQAGGPYEMNISASNHLAIKNILFGDVWICSGQSNMVLPMERVKEKYPEVIAKSSNSSIRQFFVPVRYDFQHELKDIPSGKWSETNPENVLNFTAAGYFFARDVYEKYKIPLGLINVSAGGSAVEGWLDAETLKRFPEQYAEAQKFMNAEEVSELRRKETNISREWYAELWNRDEGSKNGRQWLKPGYDAAQWRKMNLPAYWDEAGGPGMINGVVWFRKEVELPAAMAGKSARLFLGRIVDSDSAYVNGEFTGSVGYQYPPRRYQVKTGVLKAGKNIIMVRVISNTGRAGFIKDKNYQLVVDNQVFDLKGEWQYKTGAEMESLAPSTFFQGKPLGLYNGMIAPLINYTIKGALWYQGEANADYPSDYSAMFSEMIALWRKNWRQGEFPFIYVQLANYLEQKSEPGESQWAELRDEQQKVAKMPHTAMVSAIDLGEWNDIHPLDKENVGKRLALAARYVAYGETQTEYSGPVFEMARVKSGKVTISFSHAGDGLTVKGGGELRHFAIAGADGKWVWAKAKISGKNVIVWSNEVKNPVEVRYAWADNPEGANLYNKNGLPANPFRTRLKF
jgi:sialate O-acetylesterase